MLPNGKGTSTPILVDILKQELLSCKRQLKDQQASNQFLKKEKYKVEHEKNLMQIQLNQDLEKLEGVLKEYEQLKDVHESLARDFEHEKQRMADYIGELEHMNKIQQQENEVLRSNTNDNEGHLIEEMEKVKIEAHKKEQKHYRTMEKIAS